MNYDYWTLRIIHTLINIMLYGYNNLILNNYNSVIIINKWHPQITSHVKGAEGVDEV